MHNRSSSTLIVAAVTTATFAVSAEARDANAGQRLFAANCAECHDKAEFRGEPARELATKIQGMAAGTRAHPAPITLNDEQIADVVTFFASGRK